MRRDEKLPPLPKKKRIKHAIQQLSTLDEDNLKRGDLEKLNEEYQLSKSVSFLNGDAIRWMNTRKPSTKSNQVQHVTPSRAIQLRAIFRGLDFDNSGSISLVELKDAVKYVAENSSSSTPVFEDPVKMGKFFDSMDTDGNGTIDFNEFLFAMTTQAKSQEGGDSTAQLQQIFYDFANQHRRQTIIDRIKDKNMNDTERYLQLHKLFGIQFFRDKQLDDTVDDEMEKIKEEAKRERNEMFTDHHRELRNRELQRSRSAHIHILKNKEKLAQDSLHKRLLLSDYAEPEKVSEQVYSTIERGLKNFSSIDKETFVPGDLLKKSKSSVELKHQAIRESKSVKVLPKSLLLPPPVSRKTTYDEKMKDLQSKKPHNL